MGRFVPLLSDRLPDGLSQCSLICIFSLCKKRLDSCIFILPMISDKSVQEVIETAKVEEVIEDFINLTRRGVNMIGLCPFHNEKTPSFTVSPAKNIYKCFGCGKAGNSVRFLMDHDSLSFPDAIRTLARKYNIELEETESSEEQKQERQLRDSLFLINEFAQKYYETQLFESPTGKSVGLQYFKERGFREEVMRSFGLGYAHAKGDAFTLEATQKGHKLEMLQQLGLTSKYGKDFFRDRVMFTLHNLSGKVVGFAGRIMGTNPKAPKYINSPETEIYHKSKFLYGAYHAKRAIRQLDECIMVEGYTDVISLHQAGIQNVVASSGTSLTVDQIALVKRFTPNIKILYDGDAAGIKAALRGLDLVLEQDLNVKVVLLPNGEDPDSFLQSQGLTKFEEYLKNEAKDFIFFKTDLLLKQSANDPVKKTAVIKDIVQSIARIPDPIKRSLYVRECSHLMEVSENILVEEVNQAQVKILKKQRVNRRQGQQQTFSNGVPIPLTTVPAKEEENTVQDPVKTINKGIEFQEKDLVRVIMTEGDKVHKDSGLTVTAYIMKNVESEVIEEFSNPLYKRVLQFAASQIEKGSVLKPSYWTNHQDDEIQQLAINLTTSPYEYSPNWEEKHQILLRSQVPPEFNFTKDVDQAIKRFRLKKLQKLTIENQERIKNAYIQRDEGKVMKLMRLQRKIQELRDNIAGELGTVVFGK